ncbi:MAG TPA: bifunctional indole-3-glycerol-phosphate synthase TrpC/phosphoribosylanthranilate isomerase TrpF [Candidatus Nanoarchaeia archaeon]|nr:bifunctional indole-3-glycerol-phosphate synthase TrpC/phosphoribosylanthranilate isomerase TrpF [Candidatus Nanoarchaeia archaeon]
MFLKKIAGIKKKEIKALKKNAPLDSFISKLKKGNHSFIRAIKSKKPSIIAEIKSSSPSEGRIRKSFNLTQIAKDYNKSDVQAISVLTEKNYFGGDINFIDKIKKITKKPVLRKDFIIDKYQIYESRLHGADAILLIAEILPLGKINQFIAIAHSLGMGVIVEAHEKAALNKAVKSKAKIIGINNRNLNTLEMDKRTALRLSNNIPKSRILVAESGIESSLDIALLPKNVQSVLVGTTIMRSENIPKKIKELTSKSTKVKICGNTNINDAKAALKYGADLLGFIINVPSSPDTLSINQAKNIIRKIGEKEKVVAVTRTKNFGEIRKICREIAPNVVQIHDRIKISDLKKLKKEFPDIIILKTIPVTGKSSIKKAIRYAVYSDLLLLDSKHGGSGKVHDWSISREIVRKCKCPVLLAGGLNPDNVAKAIKMVKPFGVDVNSGVRLKPRIKDHKKIRLFIKRAK